MHILYDISVAAAAVRSPGERTGVWRVVHEVAAGLAAEPGCRLTFCTPGFPRLYESAVAVAGDPAFGGARAARPPVLDRLAHRALGRVGGEFLTAPARSPAARAAQRVAFQGMRVLESTAAPVAAADLAGVDVYHSPYYPLPGRLGRASRRHGRASRLPRVLTAHDLIALRHPGWFDPHTPVMVRRIVRSLTPDDWVLAVSESTRRDLLNERPDLDPARVRVTPLAAGPQFRPCDDPAALAAARAKFGLPPDGRYLLALNTLEPRKNTDGVVRAFAALAAEPGLADVRLVLAGGKGWKFGPLLALVDALPAGVRGRVHVSGFVPDADLPPLYAGAAAFAYPSHSEGFGLPPLEAMACGTPVVTGDNSSLPEVVGDAGLLVPSADDDALAGALRRLLVDGGLRADLARRSLARAATFSWRRCVAGTLATYRDAVAAAGR